MADFTIDYTQFQTFMTNLTSVDRLRAMERRALEDLANKVLLELLWRTPFKTGYLRNKWKVDNPKIVVVPVKDGYECVLVNSTYYAWWVENGHRAIAGQFIPPLRKSVRKTTRWVEGRFFVRSTATNFNHGKATPIVTKHVMEWLTRLVNGK